MFPAIPAANHTPQLPRCVIPKLLSLLVIHQRRIIYWEHLLIQPLLRDLNQCVGCIARDLQVVLKLLQCIVNLAIVIFVLTRVKSVSLNPNIPYTGVINIDDEMEQPAGYVIPSAVLKNAMDLCEWEHFSALHAYG
jgi:hypothetical protein